MVKRGRGRHSGLLLLTDDGRAVILQANKSYDEYINKSLQYKKHLPFVEKLSIPRGRQDFGEKDYETAVREFIEETGMIFDEVYIYNKSFLLEWRDNSKTYKYNMYVAFLKGELKSLQKRPNTYNIRLCESHKNKYRVDLSRQRFYNKELNRKLDIMSWVRYKMYMENCQLPKYANSNYLLFFDFVKHVQMLYNSKLLSDFFILLLNWCGGGGINEC